MHSQFAIVHQIGGCITRNKSVEATELVRSPGHPFCERLNRLLSEEGFDAFVDEVCEPYYEPADKRDLPASDAAVN